MSEFEYERGPRGDTTRWFLETFSPLHSEWQDRFLVYGLGGLFDPKNYTFEPWVYSGAGDPRVWKWSSARWAAFGRGVFISQVVAFYGVGTVGAFTDFLGLYEGEGTDELHGDIFDWGEWVDANVVQHSDDRPYYAPRFLGEETLSERIFNEFL